MCADTHTQKRNQLLVLIESASGVSAEAPYQSLLGEGE